MNDIQTTTGKKEPTDSTIYFVVPLQPQDPQPGGFPTENLVQCAYFNTAWRAVSSKDLTTSPDTGAITFLQQWEVPSSVLGYLRTQYGVEPDPTVALFAAVAKTLGFNTDLPRTFVAADHGGAPSIEVPVQPNSVRGVVLIFRSPSHGGTVKLIATADPEIRNGSGG